MDMSISGLQQAYASGELTPELLVASLLEKSSYYSEYNIWIYQLSELELAPYIEALAQKDPATCPLWGIPFAIKDNIDLAGVPTTAACPEFAYMPEKHAKVVQQLIDAGAIPMGKTNLDQFATGLNGTRSPYGAGKNSFNPDYISGGSSAGSAVAVALGLSSFSLGTDTAGSGRVPACFNNLVGLKPSIGLLSTSGLVPACRSLDVISIFAYNSDDANAVLAAAEGFDGSDGYSRKNPYVNQARQYGLRKGPLRIGVIQRDQLKFFGDHEYEQAYLETLAALSSSGIVFKEFDYTPFDEVAKLLYEGPWVAERYIAATPMIQTQPEAIFPVVRDIIAPGGAPPATALFTAQYRLHELKQRCLAELQRFDCLLTPTAGRLFSIEEMLAEPIKYNSQLGYYTNFMNLLDLAAVAVPTCFTESDLAFGITLVGNTFSDRALLSIASRIQQKLPLPQGALSAPALPSPVQFVGDSNTIDVAVCGAHLAGFPLNWQLRERGAYLKQTTKTAACYRLYALAGAGVARPGLVYDDTNGSAIEVEVWSVPTENFGSFVANIPAPLGIGKVKLADAEWVSGFICEPYGLLDATDITELGAWRRYSGAKPNGAKLD